MKKILILTSNVQPVPDVDGEWTYQTSATKIWHQRDDNTRHFWVYTQGTSTGDNAAVGSIGARDQ